MATPNGLARPLPHSRSWRASGLIVRGNVLTGTLCVAFDAERGVTYNKGLLLSRMRRVNRRTPDGYGIQFNIRELSGLEHVYSFHPVVRVYVVASLSRTDCAGAAACFDPNWNTIRVTPQPPDYVVVHELFHKLGLGHSSSRLSVMYPNQGIRPYRDIRTYAAEVRALVDSYR